MPLNHSVNDVATMHRVIRPMLMNCLKSHGIIDNAENRAISHGATNWQEFWHSTYGDRFFDMGTFVRLGSAIETTLRDYYMAKKGHKNITELKADFKSNKVQRGIFQRLVPKTKGGDTDCLKLFSNLGIDLSAKPEFALVQEMMLHRHLYAHNQGVVDDDYIEQVLVHTGKDLKADLSKDGYPTEDIVWFKPLNEMDVFIDACKKFIAALT